MCFFIQLLLKGQFEKRPTGKAQQCVHFIFFKYTHSFTQMKWHYRAQISYKAKSMFLLFLTLLSQTDRMSCHLWLVMIFFPSWTTVVNQWPSSQTPAVVCFYFFPLSNIDSLYKSELIHFLCLVFFLGRWIFLVYISLLRQQLPTFLPCDGLNKIWSHHQSYLCDE